MKKEPYKNVLGYTADDYNAMKPSRIYETLPPTWLEIVMITGVTAFGVAVAGLFLILLCKVL